ncbi:hypothetical protein [Oleispirillum naphthae]|uniref:hypothetical protein n=1 Tax=Oleispirillum naphthae TaxID=2838853 RepID=UPI0030825B4A
MNVATTISQHGAGTHSPPATRTPRRSQTAAQKSGSPMATWDPAAVDYEALFDSPGGFLASATRHRAESRLD